MKPRNTIYKLLCLGIVLTLALGSFASITRAATLSNRSDTVSTSAINTTTSHTIRFTTATTIPVSGSLHIAFDSPAFVLPALDHEDVDVLINTTQQTLAALPGTGAGSPLGVSVVSGSAGTISIALNDTDTIAAGSTLEVRIGTAAVFQVAGGQDIPNPANAGSYPIAVQTRAADTSILDSGIIPIAITVPVGVTSTVGSSGTVATPVLSPSGGTFATQVSVSITTTTAGATIYYTLDGSTPTTGSTVYTAPITLTHSTTIQAFATKAGYSPSTVATETYTITTAPPTGVVLLPTAPVTVSPQSIGAVGASCGAGAALYLYIPPTAFPAGSTLTITCLSWNAFPIKAGAEETSALGDILFSITARDAANRSIPAPAHPLYAVLTYQNQGSIRQSTGHTLGFLNPQRQWERTPTRPTGTDVLQFEATLTALGYVSILQNTQPRFTCERVAADINCDGKVNIVDMSILMSYWHRQTFTKRADINRDARIDLIDLTILYFWWSA